MIEAKISPALWKRNEAYQIFLEYFDKRSTPLEQAELTIETLIHFSEGLEVPIKEVFKLLSVGEMLDLIHQRRFSLWLLFCSTEFKSWVNSLDPSDKDLFMKSVSINFWAVKFERNQEMVEKLKKLALDLEI